MKFFFVVTFLICLFQVAEANTCFVDEASPESTRNYVDHVGISTELWEGLADIDILVPAITDGYLLNEVFLVVSKKGSNENELFIPVATKKIEKKILGASLTLPVSLLNRANLMVTYGNCGTEYKVQLAK